MEQEILKRLKENDEEAVRWLFSTYFSPMAGVAHRIVRDQDAAKDIVQDVFVRLWTHRNTLQISTSLHSYLRRSVVNAAIDHKRRFYEKNKEALSDQKEWEDEIPPVDAALREEDTRLQINQAISTLPERCRLIFVLSRFEELTYAQIAKKLDISIKTVENQMTKALKILRQALR
ncbi:MAG: RNA polymerase sigma-70 factor [Rhodothermaceae bacterium]|nr:RNA polymerase sigma-70 factor [Rhodothermaceae bacterium]